MLVSYGRQRQFEKQIEENISILEETVKENSLNLEKNWESLAKDDPEELITHFENKAYSVYSIYFLEYHEYIQNEQKRLFSGTFRTQAMAIALTEIKSKIVSAYLYVCDKWVCNPDMNEISGHAGEYCKILLKYYPEDHNLTWNEFVNSDEYEMFLNEVFLSAETIEELSLHESYQNIIDHAEQSASRNVYSNVLSQSYMFVAENAYNEYQMLKSQKDFAGALMNAEIVYALYDTFHLLDERGLIQNLLFGNIDARYVYIHDVVTDIVIVFILSTLIVVIIYFAPMKKLAGDNKP
jgi:hypothetical protein